MKKARARGLRRETKKERLLRLLEEHGGRVPLAVVARELYGGEGELERWKVVKLLSAYRAEGILNCRIKDHTVSLVG